VIASLVVMSPTVRGPATGVAATTNRATIQQEPGLAPRSCASRQRPWLATGRQVRWTWMIAMAMPPANQLR
jgi:hypothetical protein